MMINFRLYISSLIILFLSALYFSYINNYHPMFFSVDSENHANHQFHMIPVNGGAVGPESFAFDGQGGGPYTGISDGRIIKWVANESRWIDFAVTTSDRHGCEGSLDHTLTEQRCGRPLGLSFNEETNELYIADAYMGLLKVGLNGGIATPLLKKAQGIPLVFTNALDIDPNTGIIYFTDSSTRYPRREYMSIVLSGDNTGRLIKYDPSNNEVTLLLDNLMFANGVSLSKDGKFLVVAETTNGKLLKYWLDPSKAGRVELFAELPGFPDNIKRNKKGEFWVAISKRRGKVLKWILSVNWIRKYLMKIPVSVTSFYSNFITELAVKLSEKGEILEILEDKSGKIWKSVSEVEERNGILWIGSVLMPFAAKLNNTIFE